MEALEEYASRLRTKCQVNNYPRTILITGASSGIGLEAAKLLALINPGHRLILVARNQAKADWAKEQVLSVLRRTNLLPPSSAAAGAAAAAAARGVGDQQDEDNIIPMTCDHCLLDSVREFVGQLQKRLDESYSPTKWAMNGIDALCLNAAVLKAEHSPAAFTLDGLEETFQVNHLASFLLANLTLGMINPAGRIVFTTSGLYERESLCLGGMMGRHPDHGGAATTARRSFEMIDGSDFHYKKSYAQSKLCTVAACYELHQRLQSMQSNITVNCFTPGLVTTTGLFRHQPRRSDPHSTSGQHSATAHLSQQALMKMEKTLLWGAGALVYMAIGTETGRRGGEYWRDADLCAGPKAEYGEDFRPTPIRVDRESSATLWELSCELASLPPTSCSYYDVFFRAVA